MRHRPLTFLCELDNLPIVRTDDGARSDSESLEKLRQFLRERGNQLQALLKAGLSTAERARVNEVHYLSVCIVDKTDGSPGIWAARPPERNDADPATGQACRLLCIEFNVDDLSRERLCTFIARFREDINYVLGHCSGFCRDWEAEKVLDWLYGHKAANGFGSAWRVPRDDTLFFAANVGRTRAQIADEHKLLIRARGLARDLASTTTSRTQLWEKLRSRLRREDAFAELLRRRPLRNFFVILREALTLENVLATVAGYTLIIVALVGLYAYAIWLGKYGATVVGIGAGRGLVAMAIPLLVCASVAAPVVAALMAFWDSMREKPTDLAWRGSVLAWRAAIARSLEFALWTIVVIGHLILIDRAISVIIDAWLWVLVLFVVGLFLATGIFIALVLNGAAVAIWRYSLFVFLGGSLPIWWFTVASTPAYTLQTFWDFAIPLIHSTALAILVATSAMFVALLPLMVRVRASRIVTMLALAAGVLVIGLTVSAGYRIVSGVWPSFMNPWNIPAVKAASASDCSENASRARGPCSDDQWFIYSLPFIQSAQKTFEAKASTAASPAAPKVSPRPLAVIVFEDTGLSTGLQRLGMNPGRTLAKLQEFERWPRFQGWIVGFLFTILVVSTVLRVRDLFRVAKLIDKASGGKADRYPTLDLTRRAQITAREGVLPQNHFASVTTIKQGQQGVIELVFRLIRLGHLTIYNRGHLADIRSIHFARWIMLPDRRLLFLTNYDGDFSSYLGEFQKVPGVNQVWGATEGFPRSFLLSIEGARREKLFKDFARASQVETLIWYCAYPELSVQEIERATRLRYALAHDSTRIEADLAHRPRSFFALRRPLNEYEIEDLLLNVLLL
ncbi:MAG: hypothetical protein R3E87_18170 [Burkholderiaceae bacterium]